MDDRPSVLFACRANAGRSVAAKVLAERYAQDHVTIASAGSTPSDDVHPEVRNVLASYGLDVAREIPKGFDPDGLYTAVVTMGCGEECPLYLGAVYEDWQVDDPKGQDEETVLAIVTDIDDRVRSLLRRMLPDLLLPASVFCDAA